jgi:penicillin amidase
MLLARDYLPGILDALKTEKLSSLEQKAVDELTRWDYRSNKEAAAPTIFNNMVALMLQNTFKPHLSVGTYDEYFKDYFNAFSSFRNIMADKDSAWFDDPATPAKEGQRDVMVKSFHEAIAKIEAERGANISEWAWGKSFTLIMKHPFSSKIPFFGLMADLGPLPMDGGFQVALATNPKIGDPYHPRSMTWARYIIDLSDQRNSKMVLMTGISGNFMSPHYTDQVQPWYKFELLPLMLYEDQVKAADKYHMVLNPK